MQSCIYCGHAPLIPNPVIPRWRHCPTCDPHWSNACQRLTRLFQLDALASLDIADKRGSPTVGGSREK